MTDFGLFAGSAVRIAAVVVALAVLAGRAVGAVVLAGRAVAVLLFAAGMISVTAPVVCSMVVRSWVSPDLSQPLCNTKLYSNYQTKAYIYYKSLLSSSYGNSMLRRRSTVQTG
jgi:hypothetical protein